MNNPTALPWLSILRDALAGEFADRPRIVTLATVDAQNRPHARTVILRRIDDDGALWMISSAHADKNAQLRVTPFAEIVAYLPDRREQFRLAGSAQVIGERDDSTVRRQFWQTLSDAGRATLYWPTIGERVQPGQETPGAIHESAVMPEHFELIVVHPEIVEHLTTAAIPHRRMRWRVDGGWKSEAINP
jgi:PPOX class probable FMN-dependent enzyme